MKEYWILWREDGEPYALTLSDTTADMWKREGKDYSSLHEEPEWFQDWAETTLRII